jgi:DNA-directed RNA polymerase III subunit RPC2
MALLSGEELHSAGNYLVFMNGMLLGVHRAPHTFVRNFRLLRRSGKMSEFVSVFIHYGQRSIYIASDGGRVCRPLIIVEKGRPRVETRHIKEVTDGFRTFDDFLKEGRIEFLDVNEENNCFLALSEKGAHTFLHRTHTHHRPQLLTRVSCACAVVRVRVRWCVCGACACAVVRVGVAQRSR